MAARLKGSRLKELRLPEAKIVNNGRQELTGMKVGLELEPGVAKAADEAEKKSCQIHHNAGLARGLDTVVGG